METELDRFNLETIEEDYGQREFERHLWLGKNQGVFEIHFVVVSREGALCFRHRGSEGGPAAMRIHWRDPRDNTRYREECPVLYDGDHYPCWLDKVEQGHANEIDLIYHNNGPAAVFQALIGLYKTLVIEVEQARR